MAVTNETRDTAARTEVMAVLEARYELFCVKEQIARTTDPELAEDYHRIAVRLLRARLAEEENPKVKPPLLMHCFQCAWAYATQGR